MNDKAIAPALHQICSIRPFLNKKDHSLKVHSFTQNMRPFPYNMLMPKLFKHVNCPANFFSAFDKPCIPLKTFMKSLLMSRNGHDKSMTKMYGNGLMFWVKEWTFKEWSFLFRNGLIEHI
jgi:hypothetical protein